MTNQNFFTVGQVAIADVIKHDCFCGLPVFSL